LQYIVASSGIFTDFLSSLLVQVRSIVTNPFFSVVLDWEQLKGNVVCVLLVLIIIAALLKASIVSLVGTKQFGHSS
jgi:hypothetical protein